MSNSGKIRIDDLHSSLQQGMMSVNDRITMAGPGSSGFVGFGFNPLGSVKRIDDNDAAIQYSAGHWGRFLYNYGMETTFLSLNAAYVTQTTVVGATAIISFYGTGLYMNCKVASDQALIGITVDGVSYPNIDLSTMGLNYGTYVKIASGLTYGAHKVVITHLGKGINNTTLSNFQIAYFDVITQPVGKNLLPPLNQWDSRLEKGAKFNIVSPYTANIVNKTGNVGDWTSSSVNVTATANKVYTFQVYVDASNIGGTIVAGAYFNLNSYDANGNNLGAHNVGPYITTNGVGQTMSVTFTTPANTTSLELILGVQDTCTGNFTFYNPSIVMDSVVLSPFESNGYDKIALAKDSLWNKSSAFVNGNRVDSTTDIIQSVSEITNLVPNATFERISPTWGQVFYDGFDRADGAVGGGWISGIFSPVYTISGNTLQLSATSGIGRILNGDINWTDRQFRYSFVATTSNSVGYIKHQDATKEDNWIRVDFGTSSFSFTKKIAGVVTSAISTTSYPLTAGTTYYVTLKAQGNIYSCSITTNLDYITSATTIYCYSNELANGYIGFEYSQTTPMTFENATVTAPIPDSFELYASPTVIYSFNNGIATINNTTQTVGTIFYDWSTPQFNKIIQVAAGQTYTYSLKKKVSSWSGTGGWNITIQWLDSTGNTIVRSDVDVQKTTTDSDFVQYSFSATAPTGAVYALPYFRFEGIGVVQIKELMFVQGTTIPAFHTKESRCDLISLQNDGQVITTQGTGTSEPGYRVEAEDGSISKWYRDKKTVQHWDRVKKWDYGTGWQNDVNGNNGAVRRISNVSGDTYYLSFVGTGADIIMYAKANYGISGITVDGGIEILYDFYTSNSITASEIRIPIRNLSYGQHTLKIRNTGTRNPLNTTDYWTVIESFDVYIPAIPTNTSQTTLFPIAAVIKTDPDYGWIHYDDTEGTLYSGSNWVYNVQTSVALGGSITANTGTNNTDYVEFSAVCNGIRFISNQNTDRGLINIYVDGVLQTSGGLDMYASTGQPYMGFGTTNLQLGLHKMKVMPTNVKNASSSGTSFNVDGFQIKNTMYVIDLRKNQSQALIEQKVAEHEAKDLFDAHPQAIKGKSNKERRDSGIATITINPSGTYVTLNITFSKAFTVLPDLKVWVRATSASAGYITSGYVLSSLTTTGVQLYANSYAIQDVQIGWEAIGY